MWLEVTQPNAAATPAQAARVRLYRDGSLSQSLSLNFELGGTAVNGVHIQTVPSSVTIPAGQSYREIQISARAAGLTSGPKVLLLQLASQDRYLLGNPHEALVYVGSTAAESGSAGFDRWITASTGGAISGLGDLASTAPDKVGKYLQAYGLGLKSAQEPGGRGLELLMVDGHPVLTTPGRLNGADLRWRIESATGLNQWTDAGGTFVQTVEGDGLKFTGPALSAGEPCKYYRVNFALSPGLSAASSLTALTGATRYGMSGNFNWTTGGSGSLVSNGGAAGETSRIIARTTGAVALDFEMGIPGANWDDALFFYIDGVRQAETYGEAVRVTRTLCGPASHLVMWEFTRGSGQAVIRDLLRQGVSRF